MSSCAALLAPAIITCPALAGSGDPIHLDEQTSQRLIALPELGSADLEEKDYAWGDVDHDGDIDLVVVRKHPTDFPGGRPNVLFMNEGRRDGHPFDGVLVDHTLQFAVASDIQGDQGFLAETADRDVQLADLDGDGWLDIVTASCSADGLPKHISHPRIYINMGSDPSGNWMGFRYEDARIPQLSPVDKSGFPYGPRFNAVGVGDVTGDGAPDLFFADTDWIGDDETFDVNNRLLVNDGKGFFIDETVQRLQPNMFDTINSNASAVADMNGDGANDLLVHFTDDFFYVQFAYNNAKDPGSFAVMAAAFFSSYYTTDVSVADLNNDGKPDFVTSEDGINRCFINQGNDIGELPNFWSTGLSGGGHGGESVIADLDADGFNDVIMTEIYSAPSSYDCDVSGDTTFYRNLADPPNVHFATVQVIPEEIATESHDAAVFDLDSDGLRDVVLGLCSGNSVWMNKTGVVTVTYPGGLPATFAPLDQPLSFSVAVAVAGPYAQVEGSPVLHVSIDGNPLPPSPLEAAGGDLFIATMPVVTCMSKATFYLEVTLADGATFVDPPGAPAEHYIVYSAADTLVGIDDDLEGDVSGWQIINYAVVNGAWELVQPIGAYPYGDASPDGVMAFVTEDGSGTNDDVDGGPTVLLSPVFSGEGDDALITFHYYFTCDDAGTLEADALMVSISNDGGATWTPLQGFANSASPWREMTIMASSALQPTSTMRLRFSVEDRPDNSFTNAAIDELQVVRLFCEPLSAGDLDGDGIVGVLDMLALLAAWGRCPPACPPSCPADLNDDSVVGITDFLTLLGNWS